MVTRPTLIAHADWSAAPGKRWLAVAELQGDIRYRLRAPELVGDATTCLARLEDAAAGGGVFIGFDFPIGLPLAYAERAGVTNFLHILPRLGKGEWADFYIPATTPKEISIGRPFYPARPGHARQQHLLDGLGLERVNDLRRACDRGHAQRRPAAPLFWTLGAQQVGKAAISGWRDVIGPALRERDDVRLWPFAGPLADLLTRGGIIVAESYPAEFYGHLKLKFPPGPDGKSGKQSPFSRAANAETLLAWAAANPVQLSDDLVALIRNGFGPKASGEDPFDAVVGLVGMLNILFGHRPAFEPPDAVTRQVEGWILGQLPS